MVILNAANDSAVAVVTVVAIAVAVVAVAVAVVAVAVAGAVSVVAGVAIAGTVSIVAAAVATTATAIATTVACATQTTVVIGYTANAAARISVFIFVHFLLFFLVVFADRTRSYPLYSLYDFRHFLLLSPFHKSDG